MVSAESKVFSTTEYSTAERKVYFQPMSENQSATGNATEIVGMIYSYLKLSIGFNFAALIAGITPDINPTTTATDIDTTTGHIENGTL